MRRECEGSQLDLHVQDRYSQPAVMFIRDTTIGSLEQPAPDVVYVRLIPTDKKRIVFQFHALGLIKPIGEKLVPVNEIRTSPLVSPRVQTVSYRTWTLTPYGQTLAIRLTAIRRPF
jgi:hypothetical protein